MEKGFSLGQWVVNQRANKTLSAERRRRLNKIGFVWDPFAADWDKGFGYLKSFRKREGHCRVPYGFLKDGFGLGFWVTSQRANKDKMSSERRQRLNSLGFIWDVREAAWDEGFRNLISFKDREGHCRVPARYKENGFGLGRWSDLQRVNKNKMSAEWRRRLDEVGFVWSPLAADWDEGFGYLKAFKKREGHCRVSAKYKEKNGFRLGQWVRVQRINLNKMSGERRKRLDALGFIWDPFKGKKASGI
jgi:hypothetical protein